VNTDLRPLGGTGLLVGPITLGGGPLGGMPETFGYDVDAADAIEMIVAALDSGIRTIDTSNGYGVGRSEQRIGRALADYRSARGRLPDDLLVITKVDPRDGDYSGDRVRRSLAESAERLGISPLPLVHLHDPEFHDFDAMTAPDGALAALVEARERGEVGHIGLAGGDVHEMSRYLELGVFEVVLVHNRWTLVDRSAGELIVQAGRLGAAVVNAAVLGGGILADMTGTRTEYGYRPAPPAVLDAVAGIRETCTRWGTDIATAAIRFSTRDPRFATTIVGMSNVVHVAPAVEAASADLPVEFWAELETLLPPADSWLDAASNRQ
jgi:D-threo-aldose 1-dehydrogenase